MTPTAARLLALKGVTAELNEMRRDLVEGMDPMNPALLRDELESIEANLCTVAAMATDLQERCRAALTILPDPTYLAQMAALAERGTLPHLDTLNAEINTALSQLNGDDDVLDLE